MSLMDHHSALKTDVVAQLKTGRAEMALALLQSGKHDRAFTLHVNPTTFTTAGLQATDWLAYLGFRRNDRCSFTGSQRCYSREVPEGFELQAFATVFDAGFAYLEKAEGGLQSCGFFLPQPEGWGFFYGKSGGGVRRGYQGISGDGHSAMTAETMKETEDDRFLFRFSFIDTRGGKAFVTHYRPKHPPLSSELRSVFSYLELKEFTKCPIFEFEPCYFRTLRFDPRGDDPWDGNVDFAHRTFDAHAKQFSPAIESLLAANATVEAIGMTFLPFDKPATRIRADIASKVRRASSPTPAQPALASLPDNFDVAISFAGPERAQAEKLAQLIREAGYAVFYDDFYPEHLWGKNLAVFFDEIFRKRARFCVMFVSKVYAERKWTIHEARSAQARALEEKGDEYVLPIRVDSIELEGLLPTVGYVPIAKGIEHIAEMLIKKLQAV